MVLNDVKYAIDMLDKKSRIYSDRPTLVVAGKLVGWEAGPSLVPYGAIWSEYRRHFARFMGTRSKVDRFQDVLHGESSDFLNRLLKMPDGFIEHSRKYVRQLKIQHSSHDLSSTSQVFWLDATEAHIWVRSQGGRRSTGEVAH